jgi:hypothetical protein
VLSAVGIALVALKGFGWLATAAVLAVEIAAEKGWVSALSGADPSI